MPQDIVITEYEKLAVEYPDFLASLRAVVDLGRVRAAELWPGYTFGGLYPQAGQYGVTSILPMFLGLKTFRVHLPAPEWQTAWNTTVPKDVLISGIGFAIPDPSLRVTEIKMKIGRVDYPRVNIEQAFTFRSVAVIFAQGFIIQPEKPWLLRVYVEEPGFQRIVPIGVAYYKVPEIVTVE